ncbi:MAG: hypothetical protein V4530_14370 [Pseudomonadota bacterium]
MKTFNIAAAIVAATVSALTFSPAFAQASATSSSQGHYEWRAAPQFGPRAPLQAPKRVWISSDAQVAQSETAHTAGHYEWRTVAQNTGPRSPLLTSKRVWVADNAQMANCSCDMMKMSAADCMKEMPGMVMPSGSGAAAS